MAAALPRLTSVDCCARAARFFTDPTCSLSQTSGRVTFGCPGPAPVAPFDRCHASSSMPPLVKAYPTPPCRVRLETTKPQASKTRRCGSRVWATRGHTAPTPHLLKVRRCAYDTTRSEHNPLLHHMGGRGAPRPCPASVSSRTTVNPNTPAPSSSKARPHGYLVRGGAAAKGIGQGRAWGTASVGYEPYEWLAWMRVGLGQMGERTRRALCNA